MDDGTASVPVGIDVALPVILRPGEEGKFLEVRHRPAERNTGVDIAVSRPCNPVEVRKPVVGVELGSSGECVKRAVVLRPARLRYSCDHHWSIRLVRAKVRG